MNRTSGKLKRGTEVIYQGSTWYVEIEKQFGNVLIYDKPERLEGGIEVKKSELNPVKPVYAGLSSKAKSLTPDEKKTKAELNIYFASQALVFPSRCEECGELLDAYNAWERRCMTAHILEKNKDSFPEVGSHLQNKIFLGVKNCSCHTRYDQKGPEFRSQMKCYPVIVERFDTFRGLIPKEKLQKALDYLNITE